MPIWLYQIKGLATLSQRRVSSLRGGPLRRFRTPRDVITLVVEVLKALSIGLVCGLLLTMLYVAVKNQWPHNYFYMDSSIDPVVSRNLPRYMFFRFVPPALVFSAAGVTADRLGVNAWIAVLSAVAAHSYGLLSAVLTAVRRRRRLQLAAARVAVIALLTVLGILAAAYRGHFDPLIPTPEDLLSNVWAGAIAAVGAVFLQRVALVKHDPLSIALRCTRDIGSSLFRYASEAAEKAGISPELVFTFMIAEDIQRPRWYRYFESRIPGHRRRTTGIMQQCGAINDFESIDLAIENYLAPASGRVHSTSRDEDPDDVRYEMLNQVVTTYSEDPVFQGLVRGLYHSLPENDEWKQIIRTKLRSPEHA